jgi:AcrR family transcriptional regulator
MTAPDPARRNENARRAILKASLAVSRRSGFAVATIEAIAKQAGVGKQTIYRWWPSKAAVVLEALNEEIGPALDFPDTGDLAADLREQMVGLVRLLRTEKLTVFPELVGAAQSDPAMAAAINEVIIGPREAACRSRLERAQEQGQLRGDVDVQDVVELLYGPLYYRMFLRNRPVTLKQVRDILALSLEGLVPRRTPSRRS